MKFSIQQINNAIYFWENILAESKEQIKQDLFKYFGKNCIKSRNNIEITLKIIKIVYDILNENVFSNQMVMPNIELVDFNRTNHIAGYNYRYYRKSKSDKFYTLVTKSLIISQQKKVLNPPSIKINRQLSGKIPLMFFVNVLCHEMIHQQNIQYGKGLQEIFNLKQLNIEWNSHGKIFKEYMNIANKENGLNVKIESSSNFDFEFQDAYSNIDESGQYLNTKVLENGKRIIIKIDDDIFDEILF